MKDAIRRVVQRTAESHPLVHSITNIITANDCANIILASGGTAIMAQDEREVGEITAHSASLALNMGALRAQEAMLLAAREAKRLCHPVVLDPVAAGASRLRSEMCSRLLADRLVTVIRGNASEIHALAVGEARAAGVEVAEPDRVTGGNLMQSAAFLAAFSRNTHAVVLLSGAIDLVSDGERTAVLRGGSTLMSRITGTGCMLTSLTATYCGANPNQIFEAVTAASGVMKVCGTIAERRVREGMEGTASFRTRLIDAVSLLSAEELADQLHIEFL